MSKRQAILKQIERERMVRAEHGEGPQGNEAWPDAHTQGPKQYRDMYDTHPDDFEGEYYEFLN